MTESHLHTAHPDVVKRLKRASGHLQNVIVMIEAQSADVAQQLHAVEKAISAAKKLVIHDHLDNCLEDVMEAGPKNVHSSIAEFKNITKYL